MNQKTVGLTLRATILALALILVAGTGLLPLGRRGLRARWANADCDGGAGWHL